MPNEPITPPSAPDDIDWEGTAYRQTQIICDLNAQLAATEARAAVAERQSQQDRRIVDASLSRLGMLERENWEHKRQYPDPRWVALAEVIKLIREHFPRPPISKQALHKWVSAEKPKVHARIVDGHWCLDLRSFRAQWDCRRLPSLPWERLRQVYPLTGDIHEALTGVDRH